MLNQSPQHLKQSTQIQFILLQQHKQHKIKLLQLKIFQNKNLETNSPQKFQVLRKLSSKRAAEESMTETRVTRRTKK
jgi:hypothetical protein